MVLAALVLQGVWAPRLQIGFAMPDFGLAVLACLALLSNPSGGAWIGFLVGLIEGAMIAQAVGSHLLSRTIAGFLAGWASAWFEREHPLLPILTGMLVVIVAESLLFLMAPCNDWVAWSLRVLGKTLYNGVLVLPLMLLIRRWVAREPRVNNHK